MQPEANLDLGNGLHLRVLGTGDAALLAEATSGESAPALWGPRPAGPYSLHDAHEALAALFPADDLRVFRPRRPRFGCPCSRERVEAALRLLGNAEVESILAERGSVGVDCEFCNRRYEVAADEARALFAAADPVAH